MPPNNKIRSVLGLIIISLIYLPISGIAQCIDSNPDISNTSTLNGLLGQSFVASCNGSLQNIKLLANASNAGLTLNVYEGNGTGGTELGSVSGISFSASSDLTDFKTIDLSSEGISFTSGDTYTFAFSSGSPQSIVYDANASYTSGELYFNGFEVAGFDMVFEVETLSTDPQLSLYASSTTGTSDDEDGGQVYLVAALSGTSASDVDVTFSFGGTATNTTDYTTSTSLAISSGTLKDSIAINYSTEAIVEANETIESTITSLTNAIESGGSGTQQVDFIIQNDDAATIAISDVAISEGNSGTSSMTFTATLTGDVDQTLTVDYATSDGTASTSDSDYTSVTGTLNFDGTDGEQETFNVTINGDAKAENNETLSVTLNNVLAGGKDVTLSDATGLGTITNDDTDPEISINDVAVTEGNTGTATASFTVSLNIASGKTITVDYATSDNTATTADGDYDQVTTTTLTFTPGETSKTVDITVNGDTKDELNETFFVDLTNGTNATISDNQGQGTITNDDTASEIIIDDVTVTEGNTGTTTASFTVSLDVESGKTITVDYATSNNTATTADGDYDQETTTTLTFTPGETSKTVDITINGDNDSEADETFFVDLSNPTNATISDNQGEGTITNDDSAGAPCSIGNNDISNTSTLNGLLGQSFEATCGGSLQNIKLLANASNAGLTLKVYEGNGTGGTELGSVSGISFSASSDLTDFKTIDLSSEGISLTSGDTYTFAFSSGSPQSIVYDANASYTSGELYFNGFEVAGFDMVFEVETLSTDPQLSLYASSTTGTSDDEDGGQVYLVAALSGTSASDVDVTFSFGGTATNTTDYTTSTSLAISSGTLKDSIAINYSTEAIVEANETIESTITSLTNAIESGGSGTQQVDFIIQNDDAATIAISDVAISEGNSGTSSMTFTATLTGDVDQTLTVDYATSDGTASTSDSDYTSVTGTLNFDGTDGEQETFNVTINGDAKAENNETLSVTLNNVLAGGKDVTLSDATGLGTITNDDTDPEISINDVAVTEGNTGTATASFTVSLNIASGKTITVDYATSDNTATTADGDYDQVTTTTLTFTPGETSKTVDITVNGDTKDEPNETFFVDLTNATNATISDNQGQGTITNDDTASEISIDDVAVTEGNTGTTTASFTVSLNIASGKTITIDYATSDNTATTADGDYDQVTTTTLTFTPGETSKTVDITVNGDTKDEVDESFHVDLSNPNNATIADGRGVGMITNDDTAPGISISDATLTEGNSGTTDASFTISLSSISGKPVTVDYATGDNLATIADGDYVAISTTLTFIPGETSKVVLVTVNGDTKDEVDESFHVDLSNPNNATIADGRGVGMITNDDTAPGISISDAIITEGNSGTTTGSFTISLSSISGKPVTVDYATGDNLATIADGDYVAIPTTTLTFIPGETSKAVSVTVNGDTKDEVDESFHVDLSNPNNVTIADGRGVGMITNDDTAPGISISDAIITEGNSGTITADFTVSLDVASGKTITIDYATSDNTAIVSDGDYDEITTTTLTFTPGETSKTVSVTVNGDSKDEDDETFIVDLTNPTNATISDSQGEGTITNDDSSPAISIDDVSITEGNSGTTTADFTVSLDVASGKTITVDYATSDNTAIVSDGDYDEITTTTLTFTPGETSKTVSVTVNGDSKDEDDETFIVDLTNPTNATISDSQGEGTITNDDSSPAISIDDVTITEGNSGTTTADFTVSLDVASGKTITVDYATSDNTAIVSDGDYDEITTTTLNFTPGETSKTVSVTVNGDSKDEDDETFIVDLTNPTNATISDSQGEGTITNDDSSPAISIDDVTITEGNSGTTTADFTVSLDVASGKTITVDYATSDNTAIVSDGDYDEITTTTLNFTPGETSKTVSVTVHGDSKDEDDETFIVDITNPTNATISDSQGEGTITNDDSSPAISIDDVTITEGNSGTTTADFTVSLDVASGKTITIDYATSDNTAIVSDGDYDEITTTTLTFTPGETSKTVSVTVNGDSKDEDDETFIVDLTNPTNATISDSQGEGTITNDDSSPAISIDDVTITEGNSGTTTADFTVSLDVASGKTITVDYATSDNTAIVSDGDYDEITTTTLNFTPGETSKTVSVTVNGDSKDEDDETFIVDLTNPTNATISDSQGEGTITNDDSSPAISIDDVTITEGNSGTTTADFTVSLDVASGKTITVDYATSDNTAIVSDGDYDEITTTTLNFTPGETSKTVSVTVNGDSKDEDDETFIVDLTNPTNATISDSQGEGTITNDDSSPAISIDDVTITEGNSGTTTADFTVSLDVASGKTITVDYATSDNTAIVSDGDYDQVSTGTLTFNPGETSKALDITINGDLLDENNETFFVDLSNAINASIGDNQGVATITDDDDAPAISIDDVSVIEGDSGSSDATFTVSLDAESGKVITVEYATSDNSATTGDSDYDQVVTTTLTFNSGETSKTVNIPINGDITEESDESFFVDLSNPANATISDNQGVATITDDDGTSLPEISISDLTISEGAGVASINVILSTVSRDDITVDYSSEKSTAESQDFISVTDVTLTILAGEISASFDITINDDDTVEIDESFFINLTNASNATILDEQAEIIIENDDSSELSITDTSIEEGDDSSTATSFTVTLSNPSDFTIEVDLESVDLTATSGKDYSAFPSETLTFEPGEISQVVNVDVLGDLVVESNETFSLQLSNPINASIDESTAIGTIEDDDIALIGVVADTNGEEGASNGQFTIFSDRIFEKDITIQYEVSGTSNAGEDFEDIGSSITLPAYSITALLPVVISDDNTVEETESLVITLNSTDNVKANIGSSSSDELSIIDNDSNPVVVSESFSVIENTANGTSIGTLLATDDAGTTFSDWQIIGGNLDQDSDDNLPFAISTTGEISVNDVDDLDREMIASFDLEIIVSDGVNTSSVTVISIALTDDNDVVPVVSTGQTFEINEGIENAASLGILQAEDADVSSTTFTNWEIVSGNSLNIFSLSNNTGELLISSNVNIDFETAASHTLEISVEDGQNTSEVETILITVTNTNDNSPQTTLDAYALDEDTDITINLPGVLSNDTDADGDNLVAVLVSDVENGTLNLNSDGSFYYLPNPDFNGSDSFTYIANDGTNNSEETVVQITINSINDSPTITIINDITTSENQVVGPINFTLVDVDHTADELSISVNTDNNNVFVTDNITLLGDGFDKSLTLTPIDFSSGVTEFTIDVTDGDIEISESFTVTVTNDITAPTNILLNVTEIDEDVAIGFVVGTLQTEDTDLNDDHTYSLVEGDGDENNNLFEIDGNALQVAQSIDFEEDEFVSVRIRTTDLSGLTYEKVFEFDVIPNPELELDIPTTFTPNGDMINDTWEIENILIHQDAKVTVFSTEGSKVFESIGYEVPWDGTYQGDELQLGTYYYIIELSGSTLRQYKGFVMILK